MIKWGIGLGVLCLDLSLGGGMADPHHESLALWYTLFALSCVCFFIAFIGMIVAAIRWVAARRLRN